MADDPDVSPREFGQVIEKDPAISAKILKVANSAFYGGSNVSTINRAINILGMNVMRSLVIGIGFQQIVGTRQQSASFSKLEYWRHSLAVGTCSRILGKLKVPFKSEELFGAGIMHDIGMLILDRFVPDEFEDCLTTARGDGVPLHEVEREVLGYDHADVGGLLAEKWGLNSLMRRAISFHHSPEKDGDFYETTCIVSAANALSHQCGFTNNMIAVDYEVDPAVAEAIGLPVEQFDNIKEVMVTEVLRAQDAFCIK